MAAEQRPVVDDLGNIAVHGRSGLVLVVKIETATAGVYENISASDLFFEIGGKLRLALSAGADIYSRQVILTRAQVATLSIGQPYAFAIHDETPSTPSTPWAGTITTFGFKTAPTGVPDVDGEAANWTGATVVIQPGGGSPVVVVNYMGQPGVGIPIGGTAGQYLRKSSSTDYATGWDTLTADDVSGLSSTLSTLTSADVSLTTRLSTEETTRATADTSLTTRLSTEEVTRSSAVSTVTVATTSLTTRVSTEEATRGTADASLTTRLSTEEATRGSADTSLATVDVSISSVLSTQEANMLAGRFGIDLNFAANAYAIDGSRASSVATIPGITFTRATTAMGFGSNGLLQSFASGAARLVYDPVTLASQGILVEEARTNLCLQSSTFGTTWSAVASNVTANSTTAPDGTTTADTLVPTAVSNQHRLDQTTTITAAAHNASVYAKAAGYGFLWMRLGSLGGVFNLTDGAITSLSGGATGVATDVGNGWWRCSLQGTTAGSDVYRLGVTPTASTADYTGDGTSGIYLWGAQIELGQGASSPIPTTTASVTRAADVATVTGLALAYPMTVAVEAYRGLDKATDEFWVQIDDGTSSNRVVMQVNPSDKLEVAMTTGGAGQGSSTSAASVAVGATSKAAARLATNSIASALNGTLSPQDTTATTPSGPANLRIGSNQSGQAQPMYPISRIRIYNRALSNAELQAVTA